MNSIVLSTANASTPENHKLRLPLNDTMTLKDNLICMSHLNIYYTWKNFKQEYKNTHFDYTYVPTGKTVRLVIPDGSYSVKDLNNFIHHSMTENKHDNSDGSFDINIYANPVYNRVTVDISSDFVLGMQAGMRETLGFDVSQALLTNVTENGKLVPKIEKVNTVLVHSNLVNNKFVRDNSIIYAFTPNDQFGNLLTVTSSFPLWRFTRNATFNDIEIWFTDQDNNPLDVEDDILVELQIRDKNL